MYFNTLSRSPLFARCREETITCPGGQWTARRFLAVVLGFVLSRLISCLSKAVFYHPDMCVRLYFIFAVVLVKCQE